MKRRLLVLSWFSLFLLGCASNSESSSIDSSEEEINSDYVQPIEKYDELEETKLKNNSSMGASIYQANRLKNGVQAYYSSDERDSYVIKNTTMQLTNRLSGDSSGSSSKLVSSFKNSKGKDYFTNSLDAYVRFGSDYAYAKKASSNVRVNTTKLGYYYYESNIRDYDMSELGYDLMLEKKFHVFSDSLRSQFRVVSQGNTSLDAVGLELKFLRESVSSIAIKDESGIHTDLVDGSTSYNALYAAFDIKDVGVIGLIFPGGGNISLSITKKHITLRQEVTLASRSLKSGSDLDLYNRIYNDETHSFDGIEKASQIENDPYTSNEIEVDTSIDGAYFEGYDPRRGVYQFHIDGMNFYTSYYKTPDKKFYEKIKVKSRDNRSVYFYVHSTLPLEGSMIIDENGMQIPLPTEVMKNFGHENEEPIYETGDPFYGDVIFPFVAEKDQTKIFSVVNVMQNWGNFPIKQLSSISYFTAYYHLSTGVTETNCIAPYYALNANYNRYNWGWVLPDFRGPSGENWGSDPQYNSVGIMCSSRFMERASLPNYQGSLIKNSGLTYADLEYSYVTDEGDMKFTMRHVEMPQNDESRTQYHVTYEILKDTTLDTTDFSFFSCSGRNATYGYYSYLDENNEHVVISSTKQESGKLHNLHEGTSYFSMYGKDNSTLEENNFGLIVKSSTLNGNSLPLAMYSEFGAIKKKYDYLALTTKENLSLKQGDKIELEVILLPYGDEGKMKDQGDNVIKVYHDSAVDPIKAIENVGEAVDDSFIPTIKAKDNKADATFIGGSYQNNPVNYTVKFTGFDKLGVPSIKMGEELSEYKYSKTVPFEGYTVSYENGEFQYSFVIKKTSENARYQISID